MNNFHPGPWFVIILTGVIVLAVAIGIGVVAIAEIQPVTGADIDRIVREVQDAVPDDGGDNTVMVNVQAAAGFGIIQRAESSQSLTKTQTTTLTPLPETDGLPAWQLILIVAACLLPVCALGCWLLFDR